MFKIFATGKDKLQAYRPLPVPYRLASTSTPHRRDAYDTLEAYLWPRAVDDGDARRLIKPTMKTAPVPP